MEQVHSTPSDILFNDVALNSSDSILVAGLDGIVRYASPAWKKLSGREPGELIGQLKLEMIHPLDRAGLLADLGKLSQGVNCTPVCRILCKNDGYIWVETSISLLRDPVSGQATEVVAIARDITARKRAEDNTDVIDAAPYAVLVVGTDGIMTVANARAEALFGYARTELIGQSIDLLVPPRFRSHHLQLRLAFSTAPAIRGMGVGRQLCCLRKDGTELPVRISLDPINRSDGQFVLVSIVDDTQAITINALQELFQVMIEGAKDYAIFALDPEGFVLSWSEGAARIKGYAESEIVGKHFSCFYGSKDRSARRPAALLQKAIAQGTCEDEGWRVRRDGSQFWASVVITVLRHKDGTVRGFSKLTRDISASKRSEELLRESEHSLRLLADAMPNVVWTARPDGSIDYFNQRLYEYTGLSKDHKTDEAWAQMFHPEDLEMVRTNWNAALAASAPFEIESRLLNRTTGRYRWHLTRALPQRDARGEIVKWVANATDIDDNKRLRDELEQRVERRTTDLRRMLVEKTALLQEVHHRVKNNLQIVCSLLSMQIDSSGNDQLNGPLQNAHSRVLAMSLIHEQIYRSATLSDLNLGQYVEQLAGRLFDSYCISSRIRLELSVEPINLNVSQAIPCGLILNELVTNSLRHAFVDGRAGTVRIAFRAIESDSVELIVEDDGVGLPENFSARNRESLGLQVVDALIHQLRAVLHVASEGGAHFRFRWRPGGSD